MQQGEEGTPSSASSSSSLLSDPKVRRKYAQLVEMAIKIEDTEPDTALELYKYYTSLSYHLSFLYVLSSYSTSSHLHVVARN